MGRLGYDVVLVYFVIKYLIRSNLRDLRFILVDNLRGRSFLRYEGMVIEGMVILYLWLWNINVGI